MNLEEMAKAEFEKKAAQQMGLPGMHPTGWANIHTGKPTAAPVQAAAKPGYPTGPRQAQPAFSPPQMTLPGVHNPPQDPSMNKVAAAAFLDEVNKILSGLSADGKEKVASLLPNKILQLPSLEDVTEIIKQGGLFDRMKGFVGGGPNAAGIPMHSLGSMMGQSNPFQGMGSSLAGAARGAAGAIGSKLQGAAGAVGGFLRGGEQNGIPMHSLGGQMAESNPMTGMGGSLAGAARSAGGAISGAAGSIAQKARQMWSGGQNAQGIPMMGAKQTMGEMNPMQGMGASLKSNVPAAMAGGGSQLGGAPQKAGPPLRMNPQAAMAHLGG